MNTIKTRLTNTHIPGLDGLRAIAILGVVLYHLFPYQIKGGYLGVVLFFVLSGYLITYTCERDWKQDQFSISVFYMKRIKRIYFPLLIMIVTTHILLQLLFPAIGGLKSGEYLSIFGGYNNLWQITQNASYFSRVSNMSPFTHLWSLSIELQFYLVWPFVFLLTKKLPGRNKMASAVILLAGISLISAWIMSYMYQPDTDVSRLYYGTDTRIFSLFMGSVTALLQKSICARSARLQKYASFMFTFIIGLILLSYLSLDGQSALLYKGGMFVMSFAFCLLILLVTDRTLPFGRWLDIGFLSHIGKRSYEIYLWQYPIIFLFAYQKWTGTGALLFQIFLIGLLASGLFQFRYRIQSFLRRNITLTAKRKIYGMKKKYVSGLLSLMLVSIVFIGGCRSLTTDDTAQQPAENLERELAANTKLLETQQASAAKDFSDTSGNFTAIGDSVMLGAAQELKDLFPESIIDAKESRQVTQAKSILEVLSANKQLEPTVIIALGTNGPFSQEKGQTLIDYLGADRTIYWVNVFGEHLQWPDQSNETIRALAKQNKNVTVIDWASYAASHSEWFYDDGIHLNADGRRAYAHLIKEVLNEKE